MYIYIYTSGSKTDRSKLLETLLTVFINNQRLKNHTGFISSHKDMNYVCNVIGDMTGQFLNEYVWMFCVYILIFVW